MATTLALNWWLCLPPCGLIGMAALAFRQLHGSWAAPGAAWAAFWFIVTLLPLLLAPEYPYYPSALWLIALIALVIGFGSLLGSQVAASPKTLSRPRLPPRMLSPLFFRIAMLLSIVASLRSIDLLLRPYGASVGTLLDVANWHDVAETLSISRYENFVEPAEMRVWLCYIYFCCLLGGHYYAHAKLTRWTRTCSFFPIAASLLLVIATSAKAGFLLSCLMWVAAYLPARLAVLRFRKMATDRKSLSTRGLLWVGVGTLSLVGLFVAGMSLRYGVETMSDRAFVLDRLKQYFAAHLSIFGRWWNEFYEFNQPLTWGHNTFFGPSALFGLSERRGGVYELLPSTDGLDIDSNIFTLFRGLLQDFSVSGMLVILGAFGFISGWCFVRINQGRSGLLRHVTVSIFYITLGWSHVINPFGYTTICAATACYAALFLIHSTLRRRSAYYDKSPFHDFGAGSELSQQLTTPPIH